MTHPWWQSGPGLAASAYARGDEFFQIEAPYASTGGRANAAWTGVAPSNTRRKHGPATDLLGQIEACGWHLEHAAWVFVETGQNSRDKFLASGQQTVVSGQILGIYLFRRDDTEDPETTSPPHGVESGLTPVPRRKVADLPPMRWSD